jgi:hypothetical protein
MPASSLGGLNGWGVYLLAALVLVLILTPQLTGVARDSRASADWRILDGIRATVDSLRPGVRVVLSYGIAQLSDPVLLRGHEMTCFDGNGAISMRVAWALPNATLLPGTVYAFSLLSGSVSMARV